MQSARAGSDALRRSNLSLAQGLAEFLATHFTEHAQDEEESSEDGEGEGTHYCSLRALLQRLLNARVTSSTLASPTLSSPYVPIKDARPAHVAWLLRHGVAQRNSTGELALCAFDL